eukprot:Plantae.Rhodophyta-Rhodochaete_pulchella.ctg1732.p1 GENE.Plantae.Rhodophyta-Rhodochaete_pulchella.ctg1732~~Plantae.Rhodophyta-Rhodochaete_pulchella.ctg1732.p1  ORF type:complete len:511 (+),score=63.22 Plantae.Rhodophyta-Rhodochaete_pulchella.ctg1732:572-2104(+)
MEQTQILPRGSYRRSNIELFRGSRFLETLVALSNAALARSTTFSSLFSSLTDEQLRASIATSEERLGVIREQRKEAVRVRDNVLRSWDHEISQLQQDLARMLAEGKAVREAIERSEQREGYRERERTVYGAAEKVAHKTRSIKHLLDTVKEAAEVAESGVPERVIDGDQLREQNRDYAGNSGDYDLLAVLERRTRLVQALTKTGRVRRQGKTSAPESLVQDLDMWLTGRRSEFGRMKSLKTRIAQNLDEIRLNSERLNQQLKDFADDGDPESEYLEPPETPLTDETDLIPTTPLGISLEAPSYPGTSTVRKRIQAEADKRLLRDCQRTMDAPALPHAITPLAFSGFETEGAGSSASTRADESVAKEIRITRSYARFTPSRPALGTSQSKTKSVRFASPSNKAQGDRSSTGCNPVPSSTPTPKRRLFGGTELSALKVDREVAMLEDDNFPQRSDSVVTDENTDPDKRRLVRRSRSATGESRLSFGLSDDEFLDVSRNALALSDFFGAKARV